MDPHDLELQLSSENLTSAERDFLEYVRAHTSELDASFRKIERGDVPVEATLRPLLDRLAVESDQANALISGYSSGFVNYLRSQNGHLHDRLAGLAQAATRAGHVLPGPLYAGELPTHSFNAQAASHGATTLLLIHSGLENMLVAASRLLFALRGKLVHKDIQWPGPAWHASTSVDDLVRALGNLLAAFVRGDEEAAVYLNEEAFPFEPERELPAFAAAMAAQDFALAHELGHFVLLHLRGRQALARIRRSVLPVISKEWRQEHEADLFAAQLLLCDIGQTAEQSVLDLIYGKYVGIGLFFELDDLVVEIERLELGLPHIETEHETHPPARIREATLLQQIRRTNTNRYLFADRRAFGRLLRDLRPELIASALRALRN
ncbi:ImmA/IrrE family metallo-endopeptidase [Variovorax sp. LT2P21]|uniref:ImmA/IrrE family metallo-endopeptidase n=1 Tax=Variovorax sp. LT2P21 TaxID=3443731 RepID=UPI003F455550